MCISESLPILNMTPVILKTLCIKYIFMGVNRKFDFRQDWMFCSDLSNVISGGNLLFWWDCFFRWDFVPFCEPWTLNSPNDLKCGITLMVFTLDQCLIPCLMWTCGLLITFCMPISMMWAIWVNIFGSPPRPPPLPWVSWGGWVLFCHFFYNFTVQFNHILKSIKVLTALFNLIWNTQKSKWRISFLSAKARCSLVLTRF